jgi:hypothetical protein
MLNDTTDISKGIAVIISYTVTTYCVLLWLLRLFLLQSHVTMKSVIKICPILVYMRNQTL